MNQPSPYTPSEQRDLATLDVIFAKPDKALVAVTQKQLSIASKVPRGSIGYELARAGIKPAYPGSNVYWCGDLKPFISEHVRRATVETTVNLSRKFRDKPLIDLETAAAAEAVRINKQLLAQRDE